MRSVSKKRAAELRKRRRIVERMKASGPVCCARCGRLADDLHEPGKRSQGADPSDPDQVVPVCRTCHDEIHSRPAEAVRDGWLHSKKAL